MKACQTNGGLTGLNGYHATQAFMDQKNYLLPDNPALGVIYLFCFAPCQCFSSGNGLPMTFPLDCYDIACIFSRVEMVYAV